MDAERAQATGGQSPLIVVSGRHLHQIAADAWQVLVDSNQPPWIFQQGNNIAVVERDDDERPLISQLSSTALRGLLDRKATFVRQGPKGQLEPARPPKDVVEDLLALKKPLPVLRGIVGTPVFAADGALVSVVGYHGATRLYYEPLGDPIPAIVRQPSGADVARARSFLLNEWLGEFPFVDVSSRAHAIAAVVTSVAREMITGPTPLFAIDAPTPGTGKGFLALSMGLILFGTLPAVMTEGRNEEEMRKRITASLRDGGPVILLDNVKRQLASAALASVLTATEWKDRVLGKSEIIRLPNRTLWLATGNNIALDGEIVRRTVWIRLDSRRDRPWTRAGFKHDPFLTWVAEQRPQLVWAVLILVQHWIACGRPAWTGNAIGSFEDWARVVGGILVAAGIEGFLENREELYKRADAEGEEWREFVGCWWATHTDAAVKTGQLYDLVREWELLPALFASAKRDADDRSLKTRLGKALMSRRDRRYGDLFIRVVGRDEHQKGALYRLEQAEDEGRDTTPDAEHHPSPGQRSADVPRQIEPFLDSVAEHAEDAEHVFITKEENGTPDRGDGGTAKDVPHVPHVPPPDSKGGHSAAEHRRNVVSAREDVPQCPGCGRVMSVVARGAYCGRCQVWGVVPEWAATVARKGADS